MSVRFRVVYGRLTRDGAGVWTFFFFFFVDIQSERDLSAICVFRGVLSGEVQCVTAGKSTNGIYCNFIERMMFHRDNFKVVSMLI